MTVTLPFDHVTVGIDLGDKYSHHCELDMTGAMARWRRRSVHDYPNARPLASRSVAGPHYPKSWQRP